MEIKRYTLLKFKCSNCNEGQYYSPGEAIRCPYCNSKEEQILTEVEVGNAEKVYICLEHCSYFHGVDGCGHNSCDDAAVYERDGDHPLCPLYAEH